MGASVPIRKSGHEARILGDIGAYCQIKLGFSLGEGEQNVSPTGSPCRSWCDYRIWLSFRDRLVMVLRGRGSHRLPRVNLLKSLMRSINNSSSSLTGILNQSCVGRSVD